MFPRLAMGLFSKSPNDSSGNGASPPGKPDSPSKTGPATASKAGARGAPQATPAKPPPLPGPQAKPAQAAPRETKPLAEDPPAVVVTRTIDISSSPSAASSTVQARPASPPAQAEASVRAQAPQNAPPVHPAQALTPFGPPARPAAPDMVLTTATAGEATANASIAETFERLLSKEELDGFASAELDWWSPAGAADGKQTVSDWDEVRSLFAQLAANHVRQVRDFMLDLRLGDATLDWVAICEPSLQSLRRAADKLELADLCAALDGFSEGMAAASADGTRTISGDQRTALLTWYDELVSLMPQAFALDLDRSQRDAVILQSLLLQVPGVKKVTLDKLYAAGLSTLEAMLLATPDDVAATTGISEALATRIVARFREYRDQVRSSVPDATRTHERERVAQLTTRLRHEHYEYELAAQSWTPEAEEKKRTLRKARAQTLLDIQVVLARLGEVNRLSEIERLPFERKLAFLESFLEEARDKYASVP